MQQRWSRTAWDAKDGVKDSLVRLSSRILKKEKPESYKTELTVGSVTRCTRRCWSVCEYQQVVNKEDRALVVSGRYVDGFCYCLE